MNITYSQDVIETAAQITKFVVGMGRVGNARLLPDQWNNSLWGEVEFEASERGLENSKEIADAAVQEFGR